jgi:hypothetical protein
MFSAQLGGWHTCLILLENAGDLLFSESLLHLVLLNLILAGELYNLME